MRAPMFSPQRESESDLGGSKSEMGHRNFCGLSPIPIRPPDFFFFFVSKKRPKLWEKAAKIERGYYDSNGLEQQARYAPISASTEV